MAIEIRIVLEPGADAKSDAQMMVRLAAALDPMGIAEMAPAFTQFASAPRAVPPATALAAGQAAAAAKAPVEPKAPKETKAAPKSSPSSASAAGAGAAAASSSEQPEKRGRGRPPGSTNKPKAAPPAEIEEEEEDDRGTPWTANRNATEPTGDEEEETTTDDSVDVELMVGAAAAKAAAEGPDMDRDVLPAFQAFREKHGEPGLQAAMKLIAHYGVKKVRDIPEEHWPEAIQCLKTGKFPKGMKK